jgi:hypothetical protein
VNSSVSRMALVQFLTCLFSTVFKMVPSTLPSRNETDLSPPSGARFDIMVSLEQGFSKCGKRTRGGSPVTVKVHGHSKKNQRVREILQ